MNYLYFDYMLRASHVNAFKGKMQTEGNGWDY
jgi:hypothetical protein